ncbi:alpha-1,4-glucan:maltose-1-phosphate maltosyltransferase [Tistlia consotensis]|uniref:Alpha-1,4-glucan:maltose-1-phosphate maltosyltransferase n=1 Tax=Tistlia consotensis USBA 355 TaxID=560819 RepID=A0A1Y6CEQ7_9PROT|nr:alpha-1,4-glucan--maltose-1-phosphate maltosyltransferase [Tistlia consotensis]SMF57482.1 alpha-1,4-glucan:maltose-1-phosphate maltosyltransferase [Tistlia consotensis USBA 355]SNR45783.1 alpha-1,4-glucan:maltose-1-phosphate maltosyltransferase [Tistlia consotensis]
MTPKKPKAGAAEAARKTRRPPGAAARSRPRRPGAATADPADARLEALAAERIAIEAVSPEIDGGRFPAKAVAGGHLAVEADIFGDGHDAIDAALLLRPAGTTAWTEAPMVLFDNDRWHGSITLPENRLYDYSIAAWRDLFASWRSEVSKKYGAGLAIGLEIEEGCRLVAKAAADGTRGTAEQRKALKRLDRELRAGTAEGDRFALLMGDDAAALMHQAGPRTNLTRHKVLQVFADRPAAAFSAWYELMPRSQSGDAGRHGTFDDVVARLPYVRELGFDVLYFPPIHPIGRTNRKGRNNSLIAEADDPGSPYAIGAAEGGHDAIHPELGSLEDFRRLVAAARDHGLEIALDFAIQCSPDHPWIRQHPEWFDWRPDGTIKFAENPPKKYEDIVNVHFYRDAIPGLWHALRDVVRFWIEQGVTIFRVDNPHTKPFPFWEWLIGEIRAQHPEAIFLAEAFTRPKVMKRLAKIGFSQSYSYFTWRNHKQELAEYLTELTREDCRHTMRPNFFVNTPDINPYYLQHSGRAGFRVRLVLAATLAGNYGIYSGFELCEAAAVPGKEEYLNSEKYEIRAWDWDRPGNVKDDVRLVNDLRRRHPALQDFTNIAFYNAWNDSILYYGKRTADLSSFLLFAVNLDPHNAQGAHFEVPLWEFGLPDEAAIEVEDLVTGSHFTWHGKVQHLWLDPRQRPYAIWRLIPPGAPR